MTLPSSFTEETIRAFDAICDAHVSQKIDVREAFKSLLLSRIQAAYNLGCAEVDKEMEDLLARTN